MTIQEAANAWNVKVNTVFTYIIKGYIYGLTIENNEIIIPNIPKPYIIRKKLKTTSEYDRYILMAMDKGGYVNAKIMNIEQNIFAERLDALIRANKIYPKDNVEIDQTSNLSFVLCSTTPTSTSKPRIFSSLKIIFSII